MVTYWVTLHLFGVIVVDSLSLYIYGTPQKNTLSSLYNYNHYYNYTNKPWKSKDYILTG